MAYGGSSLSSFEDDDEIEDREVFQPPTKRGIGRGRGLLVEGEGPSTYSGRGRGRGRGGQRGKRKLTSAVRIAEEEAERFQQLRADRDRRADEMELVITDPAVLQVQQLYRNDLFARHAHTAEYFNKSMRHAAYGQYILVQYGRLGQHVRRPVPSCCTWFIRTKYNVPRSEWTLC